jgi:hypothetical protein
VSLHWEKVNIIEDLNIRASNNNLMFSRGIDFLLYNLFDAVIDEYFPLTDSIGDRIDNLEEKIIKAPSQKSQEEILNLKRDIIKLRKVLSPQREVINILLRHDFELIKDENRLYFMDVYDHILRIIDLLDSYQDLITGSMDLLMTQISNKTNEIMKVLTIITTIIMPLTLITGIYGMNFKFNDGEKVLSQYEFYFSNYLRNNLHLEYNKDYFRDIKYKTFSNCNKKINCDFVINYKGKTIYIEIIGMLKSEKKLSYRNDIYKSKSKEKYRKTLIEKEDLFIKEGLEYYFLFTEDLNNNYLNDIFI